MRDMLWRGRHHPSSGTRRRFCWRPFVTHLSLILHTNKRALFGERKGLRFNKFPIRIRGNTFTHLSHRRGGRHEQIIDLKQFRPRHRITVRQTTKTVLKVTPRVTTTLRILHLTKNIKGLRRNQTDSPSFSTHLAVSFSSFSSFLFLFLPNSSLVSLSPSIVFPFLSSILSQPTAYDFFFMHRLKLSNNVTFFLRQRSVLQHFSRNSIHLSAP